MRVAAVAAVIGIAVLTSAAPAFAQAKCEPNAVAKKYPSLVGKTIRVAQDGQSPPYSFREENSFDRLTGLDADLVRATFACLGLPVEFRTGQWSGMLPSVIAGQADVMWNNLYYTPPRAQQVNFVTYLLAATGGMVRKGNPKHIHALADTCGTRAAAGLGTVEEASLRQTSEACVAAGKQPIQIFTYQDKPSGARLLQNDRADLMMTDLGVVGQMISLNPNDFERAFTIKTDFKIGPGINKNMPELEHAIADTLKLLEANGTMQALMKKYGFDQSLMLPVEIHEQ